MTTAVVIVGSSRGFGRSLLESVIKNDIILSSAKRLLFILLSTSAAKAKSVFSEVYLSTHGREYNSQVDSHIDVIVEEVDLCDFSECQRACSVLDVALQHHRLPVRSMLAFINSGSVDPVGPLLQSSHETESSMKHFMKTTLVHINLNFLSFVAIAKTLARYCTSNTVHRARIVNISSLAAIQELYGMAIYSATKSARDSFMRSLALEIDQDFKNRDIKFLSYAPGPMLTDLVKQSLISSKSRANHVKQSVPEFIDPHESADCCVRLLCNDSDWKSGSHLDFYDIRTS